MMRSVFWYSIHIGVKRWYVLEAVRFLYPNVNKTRLNWFKEVNKLRVYGCNYIG